MDHIDLNARDSDIDLESGENTSEEDKTRGSGGTSANKLYGRARSGLLKLDKSIQGTEISDSYNKVLTSVNVLVENAENKILNKVESETVNLMDKKMGKEKRKKTKSKMPSKPPRPPKGPSLDAADIMMVREFSELAASKRKRIERMKASRKMKPEKASSRNGNVFAMIVTILFCLVIISQDAIISPYIFFLFGIGLPAFLLRLHGLFIGLSFFLFSVLATFHIVDKCKAHNTKFGWEGTGEEIVGDNVLSFPVQDCALENSFEYHELGKAIYLYIAKGIMIKVAKYASAGSNSMCPSYVPGSRFWTMKK